MTSPEALQPAFEALDDCEAALRELDAACCDPGRSPSMRALAETLQKARAGLDCAVGDPEAAATTTGHLEDAGAQVRRLRVGCCEPHRLPMYAWLLEGLTDARLELNRALGTGH